MFVRFNPRINPCCVLLKASNLYEVLVTSSSDYRFLQWLNCFTILFDISIDEIVKEFQSLRGGSQMKLYFTIAHY